MMQAKSMILLMPELEADYFCDQMLGVISDLVIHHACSQQDLIDLIKELHSNASASQPCHLFGFLTSVFVPQECLKSLAKAYNLHPGPSHRPGFRPTHFAHLEGATRHGVTLHEMATTIDAGEILAQRLFDVPNNGGLPALEEATYQHALDLVLEHLDIILGTKKPAPYLGKGWSGLSRTSKDLGILKDE